MTCKKPPFGNPDDSINNLYDVVKYAACANGKVRDSINIAKAYLEGQLSIEFVLEERRIKGVDACCYIAILQKRRIFRNQLKGFAVPRFWRDDGMSCSGPYRDDQIVHISVTELIQQDKSVAVKPNIVRSVIWFQSLNKPHRSSATLPAILESLFFEIGSVPVDREISILQRAGLKAGGAGDSMVERRPRVGNNVPNDCTPSERDRLHRLQSYMLRAIRVTMDAKNVWLTCDVGVEFTIKLHEVFLCPFHLGAAAEPWVYVNGAQVLPSEKGWRISWGHSAASSSVEA